MVSSARRRAAVVELMETRGLSERPACRLIGCSRSMIRYRGKRLDDSLILDPMRKLVTESNRTGYLVLHFLLGQEYGISVNHKRFFRIYRAAGLQVAERRKRHARYIRGATTRQHA